MITVYSKTKRQKRLHRFTVADDSTFTESYCRKCGVTRKEAEKKNKFICDGV